MSTINSSGHQPAINQTNPVHTAEKAQETKQPLSLDQGNTTIINLNTLNKALEGKSLPEQEKYVSELIAEKKASGIKHIEFKGNVKGNACHCLDQLSNLNSLLGKHTQAMSHLQREAARDGMTVGISLGSKDGLVITNAKKDAAALNTFLENHNFDGVDFRLGKEFTSKNSPAQARQFFELVHADMANNGMTSSASIKSTEDLYFGNTSLFHKSGDSSFAKMFDNLNVDAKGLVGNDRHVEELVGMIGQENLSKVHVGYNVNHAFSNDLLKTNGTVAADQYRKLENNLEADGYKMGQPFFYGEHSKNGDTFEKDFNSEIQKTNPCHSFTPIQPAPAKPAPAKPAPGIPATPIQPAPVKPCPKTLTPAERQQLELKSAEDKNTIAKNNLDEFEKQQRINALNPKITKDQKGISDATKQIAKDTKGISDANKQQTKDKNDIANADRTIGLDQEGLFLSKQRQKADVNKMNDASKAYQSDEAAYKTVSDSLGQVTGQISTVDHARQSQLCHLKALQTELNKDHDVMRHTFPFSPKYFSAAINALKVSKEIGYVDTILKSENYALTTLYKKQTGLEDAQKIVSDKLDQDHKTFLADLGQFRSESTLQSHLRDGLQNATKTKTDATSDLQKQNDNIARLTTNLTEQKEVVSDLNAKLQPLLKEKSLLSDVIRTDDQVNKDLQKEIEAIAKKLRSQMIQA